LAAANPKEDFERLLREEVKSTRTSWTDFRRTWKKDRRFWGWGSDDREREKRFREFVRELGERKVICPDRVGSHVIGSQKNAKQRNRLKLNFLHC
jgi:heat shock protein beta